MTALLPRLFGDVSDWFDAEFPPRAQLIRVEENRPHGAKFVVELPA